MRADCLVPLLLWGHQRKIVASVLQLFSRGKRGAMINAAMGTGKTAMAIQIAIELGARLILVLCPLRVGQVWAPQIARHGGAPFDVVVLDDSFANVRVKRDEAERRIRLAQGSGAPLVVVVNFESSWRSPFAEWALKLVWDLIIADEIHRCKSPGGRAARFLARLGQRARFRLGLSGTPMPHSPLDVFGYYRFLDDSIFGWSFQTFRQRYAIMGGFQNHQVLGYRNLDELKQKFDSIAFSVGKEVLSLPPELHVTYTCELGPAARKVYRSLEKDLIAEIVCPK